MTEWLYENSTEKNSRYVLGKEGVNPLVVFGINPSTAIPGTLDRTTIRVNSIALRHGYDSWIMLNVYPYKATKPKDVLTNLDDEEHELNVKIIYDLLSKYQSIDVWVAFGKN